MRQLRSSELPDISRKWKMSKMEGNISHGGKVLQGNASRCGQCGKDVHGRQVVIE